MALSFNADEKFDEIFGRRPKEEDIEIIKRAMINEVASNNDGSQEDSLDSTLEAFEEDISPKKIEEIIERFSYMFDDPEEVLPRKVIEELEDMADRFHKISGEKPGKFSNLNPKRRSALRDWQRITDDDNIPMLGIPEIYANKDSSHYDFLVLDDFSATEEHRIGEYRTTFFRTEPNEGHYLEDMLRDFSDCRRGKLKTEKESNWRRDSAIAAFSSGFFVNISPLMLVGAVSIGLPVTAAAVTAGAMTPYLLYRYKTNKDDKDTKEIVKSIDERYIKGNHSLVTLGSRKPYDPGIMKKAVSISGGYENEDTSPLYDNYRQKTYQQHDEEMTDVMYKVQLKIERFVEGD